MRIRPYSQWLDEMIVSRINIIRRQIQELEDERGGLLREQNRRATEVARVKRRLTSG